jgi:hypothetical protein
MAEYTETDIAGLPLDQMDRARFPAAVKAYLPAFDRYMQSIGAEYRQLQNYTAQLEARLAASGAKNAPDGVNTPTEAPKSLNQKELLEAARKTAAERLGVKPEDLDFYDAAHLTALTAATTELTIKNRESAARSEQRAAEAGEYLAFSQSVARLPDFAEFENWVRGRLAEKGETFDRVRAVVEQTGDYRGYMNGIRNAYQAFKARGSAPDPARGVAPGPVIGGAAPRPPQLEGGGGNPPSGTVVLDFAKFASADSDTQARLLRAAGYV